MAAELARLREKEDHEAQRIMNAVPIESDIDSLLLRKQVEDLKALTTRHTKEVSSNITTRREELIACLRTNQERGLDCASEVKEFKRAVDAEQRRFIEKFQ